MNSKDDALMNTELQRVLALIDEAFTGIERDEECTLHQAQLADRSMSREISDDEWQAAGNRDSPKNWREVPSSHLDECDAALSHLSPQGWHFYLPAYMRRALELLDEDFLSTRLPGSVIFHLSFPPPSKGIDWYLLVRFRQVNDAQVGAIVAFLQYIVEHAIADPSYAKDAARALKRYWSLPKSQRPNGIEIAR